MCPLQLIPLVCMRNFPHSGRWHTSKSARSIPYHSQASTFPNVSVGDCFTSLDGSSTMWSFTAESQFREVIHDNLIIIEKNKRGFVIYLRRCRSLKAEGGIVEVKVLGQDNLYSREAPLHLERLIRCPSSSGMNHECIYREQSLKYLGNSDLVRGCN